MENVEIRKTKWLHKKFLKVDLAFQTKDFDAIVIKGFRIGPSREFTGLWVQPPSYQVFSNYFPCFFMENKDKWKQIEDLLVKTYKEELAKSGELNEKLSDEEIADFMDAEKIE